MSPTIRCAKEATATVAPKLGPSLVGVAPVARFSFRRRWIGQGGGVPGRNTHPGDRLSGSESPAAMERCTLLE